MRLAGRAAPSGVEARCARDAQFAMGELFRTLALRAAGQYGFEHPRGDDERALPADAKEIY